jgi:hypothetical protein
MLSDAALILIRGVFKLPDLFSSASRIDRRVVAWGKDAEAMPVPHSATVVTEAILLDRLATGFEPDPPASPDFTIHASKPLPAVTKERRFGSRPAVAAQVNLKNNADASTCWIESLADGWLFLIPNASGSTWLLGIGAPLEPLLASSRVIAPRIELLDVRFGEFPACPRMAAPIWGEGWIACGTAAVGFDPMCGDGTAQAVREAILAAAVIRAIADGGDASALFTHYEARLTSAMLRHLTLCIDFYRGAQNGPWWTGEIQSMADGQRWCATRLAVAGEPRYRLRGFVLESIEPIYNRYK